VSGTLVVCGVPIGDPRDASGRLGPALAGADIVAAEDTRRARRLAAALEVTIGGRLISYRDLDEAKRAERLVADIAGGATVVLVTDAGMPGVSDPGYRVVSAAAAAGLPVTLVPGPSAVTGALAVSGLPTDRWTFEGFLPRRAGARRGRLVELAREPRTMVILESPKRVAVTLGELASALGEERPGAVCRELTKTHEEIVRDGLGRLRDWAAAREVLGEVTLVVAGAPKGPVAVEPNELADAVAERVEAGEERRQAILAVAAEYGVRRGTVYDAVVAARGAARSGVTQGHHGPAGE
jgi:16S rRNA (cytidine1402-2'-O)-methyltransferase